MRFQAMHGVLHNPSSQEPVSYSWMVFEALFILGALGIVVMALLGISHGSGHHAGGTHHTGIGSHVGSHAALPHATAATHGALPAHTHAHAHVGQQHSGPRGRAHHGSSQGSKFGTLLATLIPSPIDIFAMFMGAGFAGLIFGHMVAANLVWLVALGGAFVLDFLIVRPMFAFILQFGSRPSAGLEGLVAYQAEAISHFDRTGKGLVKVNMDGQIVQLLARLDSSDIQKGTDVQKGDQLIVTQVNSKNSTCNVTRELSL